MACEKSTDNLSGNNLVGVYENTGTEVVNYYSVDGKKGKLDLIGQLEEINSVHQGESTYDPVHDYFIFRTNLGITIIDTKSVEIKNSFEGITMPEFNPADNMIYGIYWNREVFKEYFAKADPVTGEITTISELPGIEGANIGSSTFDFDLQNYCFIGNGEVVVVDISDGKILKMFDGIEAIEYEQKSGKLIGLSNDSTRKLLRADMQSGEITVLGETSIEGIRAGVSAFDQENGYYIIMTGGNVVLIDPETLNTINSFSGLTEIEYLNRF